MAEVKTKPSTVSVRAFLDAIEDPQKRKDAKAVARMMKEATGARPKMWGPNIVGYGTYHYKYASGREGDWMLVGFSPRKQALTLYIMSGFKRYESLLKKLGKHSTGKSCLYIKRLEDVDTDILGQLIGESAQHVRDNDGC